MKIPFELHDFILQGIKQTSSRLVNEPCAPDDPFHNCQRVKDDGTLGITNMVSIFFTFSFFAKNEKFCTIFREKRKKKPIKKLAKMTFFSTNFAENFNFWLVKISGHAFSSFFAIIFKGNVLEHAKSTMKL